MCATESRKGPDSMQQDAQCAAVVEDLGNDSDDLCDCTDPDNNCERKEVEGSGEGENMSAALLQEEKEQEPYPKTVTGVIRIMHASGRRGEAEFWEELKETEEQAKRLLDSLQKLHRKKTGCYPTVPKHSQQAVDE